jgi:hypothetical protein
MKKVFFSICVLFITFEGIAQTNSFTTYNKNGVGAFSISYPRNWEIQEQLMNDQVALMVLAPLNGNGFRTNFNIVASTTTNSLEEYSLSAVLQMRQAFDNVVLESKDFITINGRQYYKTVINYILQGHSMKGIQYAIKKKQGNSRLYTLTFTMERKNYVSEKDTIDRIIQSFNF